MKDSNLLREEAFGLLQDFLPRADVPTLAVCNTLNWPRSGLVRVFIDHEMLPPDRAFRILDGAQPVAVQAMERRSEGTYWALWVRDVPPLGFKILRIETSDQPRVKETPGADSLTLENEFYKLTLDADKGAIKSLVDKETGQELVDQAAAWGLGQCIYETMPSRRDLKPDVFKRTSVRNVTVKPGANGPIWKSLLLTADLDGCATNSGVRAEIRLYDTEKRIELHFADPQAADSHARGGLCCAPVPVAEQQDALRSPRWLRHARRRPNPRLVLRLADAAELPAIRNADGQIVMGSEQAPLVQLGDFNLGKWQPVTRVEKPHVYSWVMNNYWFTNFRTEQEGEFKFHYYLTSTEGHEPHVRHAVRLGQPGSAGHARVAAGEDRRPARAAETLRPGGHSAEPADRRSPPDPQRRRHSPAFARTRRQTGHDHRRGSPLRRPEFKAPTK